MLFFQQPKQEEFSKSLLRQESALIWIMSISFIALAFYCIHEGFTGSLPWLAAMVGFPWTAYGVSQMCYYKKSLKENTRGGVKFESIMADVKATYGKVEQPVIQTEEENWLTQFIKESSKDYNGLNLDYGI